VVENGAKIAHRSRSETVPKSPETEPKLGSDSERFRNSPFIDGDAVPYVLAHPFGAPFMNSTALIDTLGRPLGDLRVSVTDRCNFRCRYCMPRERFGNDHEFLRRSELLSFEELLRVVTLLQGSLRKVRLTGGEPLLRRDLPQLVQMLAGATQLPIALTTNGVLLPRLAASLAQAGLERLTISLDALDEGVFQAITDADYGARDVLAGVSAAESAGFSRLKINCVVRRGMNESEILPLARHFHGSGHVLRFIEYMDVGSTNGWRSEQVMSAAEIVEQIDAELPLEPLDRDLRSDVASRFRYRDGGGEIGVIASMSQPFCGDCSRLRLSADGQLYTCLFAVAGHDLRGPLRAGASDAELSDIIRKIWESRADRYSEQRAQIIIPKRKLEMSYIGG
jgi:cyclic pyranopterin phosphate synthase